MASPACGAKPLGDSLAPLRPDIPEVPLEVLPALRDAVEACRPQRKARIYVLLYLYVYMFIYFILLRGGCGWVRFGIVLG